MIENGIDFGPGTVSGATVATYVKTLSPATASPPLRPSSKNCWLAEPPIDERFAVTTTPLLAGFVPGVTVTVNVDAAPGRTEFGLAVPTPEGFVAASTPSEIEPVPVRENGLVSFMGNGGDLIPPFVPSATVALNEKTLSPAVTSPCVPSSKNCCDALPPIADRSAVTVCTVLGGLVPGVTPTVKSVELVAATELGFAAPTPLGLVAPPFKAKIETLSIASACAFEVSKPEVTEEFQARNRLAPLATVTFRILLVTGTVAPGAVAKPLLSASGAKAVKKLGPALVHDKLSNE